MGHLETNTFYSLWHVDGVACCYLQLPSTDLTPIQKVALAGKACNDSCDELAIKDDTQCMIPATALQCGLLDPALPSGFYYSIVIRTLISLIALIWLTHHLFAHAPQIHFGSKHIRAMSMVNPTLGKCMPFPAKHESDVSANPAKLAVSLCSKTISMLTSFH